MTHQVLFEKDDFDHLRCKTGFTYAFWMQMSATPKKSEVRSVFYQWTDMAAFDIRCVLDKKMLKFIIRNEHGEETTLVSERELVKNRWYFVCLRVYEHQAKNTDFDIFIDGRFDSEGALYDYHQNENVGVTCGKFKKCAGMDGFLGDFILYAQPLTDAEIREAHQAGLQDLEDGMFTE